MVGSLFRNIIIALYDFIGHFRHDKSTVIHAVNGRRIIQILSRLFNMSATTTDGYRANAYAFERAKLAQFNYFLKILPHVASHVVVEIHPYRELQRTNWAFRDDLIKVRLKASETFCQQTRCNPAYPRGKTCTDSDGLQIFKSGNSTVTACQKACRLYRTDDGNDNRATVTQWSSRCDTCVLYDGVLFAMGIDDYRRTDKHPTPHEDTVGTGYDVADFPFVDEHGDETFGFALNSYYCEDFDMVLDADKLRCKMASGVEKAAGFVFGDYVTHMAHYLFADKVHGRSIDTVKTPRVPPVTLAEKYEIHAFDETWKYSIAKRAFFIDPRVKLSQLGIIPDGDNEYRMYWTTEYGWPGRLVGPATIPVPLPLPKPAGDLKTKPAPGPDIIRIDFEARYRAGGEGYGVPKQFRVDAYGVRSEDEYDLLKIHVPPEHGDADDVQYVLTHEYESFAQRLRHYATVVLQIGDAVAIQTSVNYVLRNLSPTVVKLCAGGADVVSKTVLYGCLRDMVAKTMARTAAGALAKRTAAKVVGDMALPLGIGDALAVSAVADGVLQAWDPLRTRSLIEQSGVDFYSKLDIELKKNGPYGRGTVEFSPILFFQKYRLVAARGQSATAERAMPKLNENVYEFLAATADNASTTGFEISAEFVVDPDVDHAYEFYFRGRYLRELTVNSDGVRIVAEAADDRLHVKTLLKSHRKTYRRKSLQAETANNGFPDTTCARDASLWLLAVYVIAMPLLVTVARYFTKSAMPNRHDRGVTMVFVLITVVMTTAIAYFVRGDNKTRNIF